MAASQQHGTPPALWQLIGDTDILQAFTDCLAELQRRYTDNPGNIHNGRVLRNCLPSSVRTALDDTLLAFPQVGPERGGVAAEIARFWFSMPECGSKPFYISTPDIYREEGTVKTLYEASVRFVVQCRLFFEYFTKERLERDLDTGDGTLLTDILAFFIGQAEDGTPERARAQGVWIENALLARISRPDARLGIRSHAADWRPYFARPAGRYRSGLFGYALERHWVDSTDCMLNKAPGSRGLGPCSGVYYMVQTAQRAEVPNPSDKMYIFLQLADFSITTTSWVYMPDGRIFGLLGEGWLCNLDENAVAFLYDILARDDMRGRLNDGSVKRACREIELAKEERTPHIGINGGPVTRGALEVAAALTLAAPPGETDFKTAACFAAAAEVVGTEETDVFAADRICQLWRRHRGSEAGFYSGAKLLAEAAHGLFGHVDAERNIWPFLRRMKKAEPFGLFSPDVFFGQHGKAVSEIAAHVLSRPVYIPVYDNLSAMQKEISPLLWGALLAKCAQHSIKSEIDDENRGSLLLSWAEAYADAVLIYAQEAVRPHFFADTVDIYDYGEREWNEIVTFATKRLPFFPTGDLGEFGRFGF